MKNTTNDLGVLAAVAGIIGVCITGVALIPAFGQWLYPRAPVNIPNVTNSTIEFAPTQQILTTATVMAATLQPTEQSNLSATPSAKARTNPCIGEEVLFDGNNVTVNRRGECHISLAEGEVIAGTADRFQDAVDKPEQPQPPCVAFVIKGPLEIDLKIWYGGWNYHTNSLDDKIILGFLESKIAELQNHQTCPSRGIQSVAIGIEEAITSQTSDCDARLIVRESAAQNEQRIYTRCPVGQVQYSIQVDDRLDSIILACPGAKEHTIKFSLNNSRSANQLLSTFDSEAFESQGGCKVHISITNSLDQIGYTIWQETTTP